MKQAALSTRRGSISPNPTLRPRRSSEVVDVVKFDDELADEDSAAGREGLVVAGLYVGVIGFGITVTIDDMVFNSLGVERAIEMAKYVLEDVRISEWQGLARMTERDRINNKYILASKTIFDDDRPSLLTLCKNRKASQTS